MEGGEEKGLYNKQEQIINSSKQWAPKLNQVSLGTVVWSFVSF